MSVDIFKDFINSSDFNNVIYNEYDFAEIEKNNNTRIMKRTNYKLNKLRNIDFPFILFKLVEDLMDKINLELIVRETYTYNNLNFYCNIKSELDNYKFIEDIYYNVNLKCDNNVLSIETSIEKKYDENKLNEIDKLFLNVLLFFIENNYTSYVKHEIFKKKLEKINLRSFVLNIT
jgi:hypothetical protein|uniref:Uncharacterized protein n=1 Tax=viral metagenome TaxID=1070528 RepID=A0A6C0DN99_9ZZZZ